MLQVLYSRATRELELSGTRPALLAFGTLLREDAGSCELSESRQPEPYDGSLARIVFRAEPGHGGVAIVAEGEVLRIAGGREALDLLAENIEGFADEAEASDHCHVEFQTYDYIAEESDPLVIAFLG
ncbi:Imm32 family immunity protein [Kitasatospora sp. NPDC094028]